MSGLLLAAPGFHGADEAGYELEDSWLRPALSPRQFLEEQELFAKPQSRDHSRADLTQPPKDHATASGLGHVHESLSSASGIVGAWQPAEQPDSARSSVQSFASGTASRISEADDRDHQVADELLSDFFSNLPGCPPVAKRADSIPDPAFVKRPVAQHSRGPRAPALKVGEWQNADLAEPHDDSYQEAEFLQPAESSKPKSQKRRLDNGFLQTGKTGKSWWSSSWPADRGPWEFGEDTSADREPTYFVREEEDFWICPAEYQELATAWRKLTDKVWATSTLDKHHHAPTVYGHTEALTHEISSLREWKEEFFGASGSFSTLPIVASTTAFERGDYRRKTMSGRVPLGVKIDDLENLLSEDEEHSHEAKEPSSPRYAEGVRINSFAEWHEEFFGSFGFVSSVLPEDPNVGVLRPVASRGPAEERRFQNREAEEEALILQEREAMAVKMQAAFRGKKVRDERRAERETKERERRAEAARRRKEENAQSSKKDAERKRAERAEAKRVAQAKNAEIKKAQLRNQMEKSSSGGSHEPSLVSIELADSSDSLYVHQSSNPKAKAKATPKSLSAPKTEKPRSSAVAAMLARAKR
eukprot:gnl/MRDRNA2_/MRDRNA2_94376_c0_seq1.p1 gnl/MRDRNA2_/MRDRNA2_94376_c0~~gnl/MRDRNA2_/MRDRNA2_94376_c0_seq1.p1  ORF type:complete len:587 (-),score=116.38 gnl/MRDRNA2_/MRDRNA2_94376_c0_seq1:66-1826(-)